MANAVAAPGAVADYPGAKKKAAPKTDDADLHDQALKRFDAAWDFDRQNRDDALDDLKFAAGEQWPEDVLTERRADGRPCLTINRLPQFVRQVIGDIRQNKPTIKVRAVGGGASEEVADVLNGLIRNIESQSRADQAYTTGAENAAYCGMGHWRVTTEYSSNDGFEQDIRIRRIANPFAVLWDPLAQELDKSDAKYCFVTDRISRTEFKAQFPKAQVVDFQQGLDETAEQGLERADWWGEDTVRIAEYWVVKTVKKRLGMLADGRVVDIEEAIREAGSEPPPGLFIRERTVDAPEVCQYLISGLEVLEGPTIWAGRMIPIVTVPGEEIHIGERVVRRGIVRDAKDPQRVFNYMRSASVEIVALQPKAPFIATADQVAGHEDMWKNAGKKNLALLLYNPDPTAATLAPQRVQPPTASQGLLSETGLAAEDMKAVTGIYDASLGQRSNETSGKAILARQREGDVGTFVYVDNLSTGIERTGRILVDLIPRIYDTERAVRILHEDGTDEAVKINRTVREQAPEGGVIDKVLNDLTVGEYDVTVTVGPSYSTKRVEAADSMMAFVQAVPQAGAVVADLVARNMDWPGADKIAERLKKLLPPGLDDEGGMQPPAPPPPDPKALADAEKAAADAQLSRAKAEGQEIENTAAALQLQQLIGGMNQAVMAAVQQILPVALQQTMQQMIASGPQPAAPGPMPPQPMPGGPMPGQPSPGGF